MNWKNDYSNSFPNCHTSILFFFLFESFYEPFICLFPNIQTPLFISPSFDGYSPFFTTNSDKSFPLHRCLTWWAICWLFYLQLLGNPMAGGDLQTWPAQLKVFWSWGLRLSYSENKVPCRKKSRNKNMVEKDPTIGK